MKINHTDEQGKVTSSNEVTNINFSILEFNNPAITFYPKDRYIIETGGGHEGVSTHFLFNPKEMKLYDIYADLERNTIGYMAYPIFTPEISGDNLTLTESRYCCDIGYNPGGHEKLTYDLNTMKLTSKKLIAPIDMSSVGSNGKPITLTSSSGSNYGISINPQDYGFSVQNGETSSYVVLNIDFITNFYKDAKPGYEKLYLDEITGVLYDNKYLRITKMKAHDF